MTYKIQIDDLVRDANEQEIAQIEADIAADKAKAEAAADKAKAKQVVLDRLGITADEARMLLS